MHPNGRIGNQPELPGKFILGRIALSRRNARTYDANVPQRQRSTIPKYNLGVVAHW